MAEILESNIIPTVDDAISVVSAKVSYDRAAENKSQRELSDWFNSDKNRFFECHPRGVAWRASPNGHAQAVTYANRKKLPPPSYEDSQYKALRYLILALTIGWEELVSELVTVLKHNPVAASRARSRGKEENSWCTSKLIMQQCAEIWARPTVAKEIATVIHRAQADGKLKLTEAVEKHGTLNAKLFTKEEQLKEPVRAKLLAIVDEFLGDLKEQDIKIKVNDILLIGSNASYNYTKDSDIDLHILADTRATKYEPEIAAALYGAYRTLFNKQLDIKILGIPVEVFVETEDSPRVSNGVYSVKRNKWVKHPEAEEIPEYDKEALATLVEKWEEKCKDILDQIKRDELKDETKVVKLLEDIYEKLRKKGVAKSEYSIENLAFKELRNNGYLDKLKESRNELVSKRLSLEETLNGRARADMIAQIAQAVHSQPILQDNGMFFIYNIKASDVSRALSALRQLPFVVEAYSHENGKYDLSNVMELAMNKIPSKYYDIRGQVDMSYTFV